MFHNAGSGVPHHKPPPIPKSVSMRERRMTPDVEKLVREQEWAEVPGFPDYRVSKSGLVLSCARYTKPSNGDAPPQWLNAMLIQPTHLKGGSRHKGNHRGRFMLVSLVKDRRKTLKYLHIIMAEAFLGPKPEGHVIKIDPRFEFERKIEFLQYVPGVKFAARQAADQRKAERAAAGHKQPGRPRKVGGLLDQLVAYQSQRQEGGES